MLLGAMSGIAILLPDMALHSQEATPKGGDVTLLVNPEPSSLTSLTTTGGAERKISPKITEGLLAYDFDLTPKPQLAKEWSVSEDGLTYRFKLREGVKWHDGKPFTSADVAASIKILKESHPRGRTVFANVTKVDTPSEHEAVILLSKPAPYLISALAASESPIVPAHIYSSGDVKTNPANIAPIGTGPFRFVEWVRGSHVVLERNPDHWDEGKPHIDTLIIRFIADAGARAAALETGELDLAGENPVPIADLARLAALPNLEITDFGYSYNANGRRMEFNLQKELFANPLVRQALAHAINRKQIVDSVYLGRATPAFSPINEQITRFFTDDIEHYDFDTSRSEALLDQAGYPRKDGGIRFDVTLDFNPYGPDYGAIANVLRSQFAAIGVDVTVRAQDFPTYVKRIFTDRDFDFHITGMSNLFDPTVGVQRIYWSKSFQPGVPFSNGSAYKNQEVDSLLEAAAVEIDEAKRREQFVKFQKVTAVDIPNVNLVSIKEYTVANKRVKNHTVTADGLSGNFSDLYVTQ